MLDISEKRFLAILPQINFLLSLLIVFHHGFISIVRYNGSFSPFSYGLTVSIERYLYNISECAVPFLNRNISYISLIYSHYILFFTKFETIKFP